ncbi:PaaI family thioesterase [Methylobacterium sp. Leaf361]|uniref:PaaI family thioesterase n=1 Tax=Methylobacterium sp. Leaf361 TaxID=1736352 RepID=UPI000A4B081B|nr:PaaI family thioesterase [Methylobacterium sp. Leaf361]
MDDLKPDADANALEADMPPDAPKTRGGTGRLGGGGPGLTLLRAMATGEILPPSPMSLLGIEFVSVAEGNARLRRRPVDYLYEPFGPAHGTTVAALFDLALGSAFQSVLPDRRTYTTLDTRISYLRPVKATTGELTVTAKIIDVGEQRMIAEAHLDDAEGQTCAKATMTCLIVDTPDTSVPAKPDRSWDVSDWYKIC